MEGLMACTDFIQDINEIVSDGTATWFCCGSAFSPYCGDAGFGACGTCDNYNRACAWPNLCCGFSPQNYAANCRPDLLLWACGDLFSVTSYCNLTSTCVYIASHGPNTDGYCTHGQCRQDIQCYGHIIDLTPTAFMDIASLSDGAVMVVVKQNTCWAGCGC